MSGKFYKSSFQICLVILVCGFYAAITAQQPSEHGRFILYKYLKPIGEENYEIAAEGTTQILKTNFELSFIGKNRESAIAGKN